MGACDLRQIAHFARSGAKQLQASHPGPARPPDCGAASPPYETRWAPTTQTVDGNNFASRTRVRPNTPAALQQSIIYEWPISRPATPVSPEFNVGIIFGHPTCEIVSMRLPRRLGLVEEAAQSTLKLGGTGVSWSNLCICCSAS